MRGLCTFKLLFILFFASIYGKQVEAGRMGKKYWFVILFLPSGTKQKHNCSAYNSRVEDPIPQKIMMSMYSSVEEGIQYSTRELITPIFLKIIFINYNQMGKVLCLS